MFEKSTLVIKSNFFTLWSDTTSHNRIGYMIWIPILRLENTEWLAQYRHNFRTYTCFYVWGTKMFHVYDFFICLYIWSTHLHNVYTSKKILLSKLFVPICLSKVNKVLKDSISRITHNVSTYRSTILLIFL